MLGQRPATAPLRAKAAHFKRVHVGGVDQAPALVHGRVGEQPLHRARPVPGQAILDLLGLLGDVHVDRGAGVDAFDAFEAGGEGVRRDGAQGVWGRCRRAPGAGPRSARASATSLRNPSTESTKRP